MAIILTPGINSKKGWHKRHCDFQSVPDACLYYFSHHAMLIFILVLLVIIPASLGFPVDDDVTNDSLGNYSLRGKNKILLSFVFILEINQFSNMVQIFVLFIGALDDGEEDSIYQGISPIHPNLVKVLSNNGPNI